MKIPSLLRYVLTGLALIAVLTYAMWTFYRVRIVRAVSQAVSERINGKFTVQDIGLSMLGDFPNVSLTLTEPRIVDTLSSDQPSPLFGARKVYLQMQPWRLFWKELSIKSVLVTDGYLSLINFSDSASNFRSFRVHDVKKSEPGASPVDFAIQLVQFKNVRLSFLDQQAQKTVAFRFRNIKAEAFPDDSLLRIHLHGPAFSEGLIFDPKQGGYISQKEVDFDFHLAYSKSTHDLRIFPSTLAIEGDRFDLEGNVRLANPIDLQVTLRQPEVQMDRLIPLLTRNAGNTLKMYRVDRPFPAELRFHGKALPHNTPPIDVTWETKGATIKALGMVFTKVSMRGKFINNVDSTCKNDDSNSRVTISGLTGKVEGLPFQATIIADDLTQPQVHFSSHSTFNLRQAKAFVDASKFKLEDGKVDLQLRYFGGDYYLDSTRKRINGKVMGTLRITDGRFRYLPRRFQFTKLNALFHFDESDIHFPRLDYTVNNNAMQVRGNVRHFIPFLFFPARKMVADAQVKLGPLDLSSFITPRDTLREKPVMGKGIEAKVAQKIDSLIDQVEIDMQVTAPEVTYGNFKASEVKGGLVMTANSFQFANLSMAVASGNFYLTGGLNEQHPSINQLRVNVRLEGADVQQLFQAFDNFHQKTIVDENLRGLINADIAFQTDVTKAFRVIPESMQGTFHLRLNNGQLLNFEPLQKLSRVIFKKRDFNNITFAAIDNRFQLHQQELSIERLEIQSSVFSFFVEGTYSFRDRTDLSIQIPLSNLKKRDPDYVPELVGPNAKVGSSVFLRARNRDGKMHIGLDLFNGWKKDNPKKAPPTDSLQTEIE